MRRLSRNAWPFLLASLLLASLAVAVCLRSSLDAGSYVALDACGDEGAGVEGLRFYSAELSLDGPEVCTDVMHFDGESVEVVLNCQEEGTTREAGGDLRVELHRVRFGLVDEFVSSQPLPRNGRGEASWENVGPGDYYFKFEKDDDDQAIRSRLSNFYAF